MESFHLLFAYPLPRAVTLPGGTADKIYNLIRLPHRTLELGIRESIAQAMEAHAISIEADRQLVEPLV